jgi:hypothetical protein
MLMGELLMVALAVAIMWVVCTQGLNQVLGYYVSNNGLLTDTPAITTNETSFSARNGHWIFTEQYDLAAVFIAGATVTQAQIFDSTYNAINIPQLYPPNLSITPLTNPNVLDLRMQPWPIPMNEEFAMQISGGAGGAEPDYALLWIVPSGSAPWLVAPPPNTLGSPRIYANVTATVALTAQVWSPFVTMAFVNPLKGGAYQVNGAWWIVGHSLAYKHNFVKAPLYNNRKMFPGGLVENAYGNVPLRHGTGWMGAHGRFNNFELPQVAFLGTTTEASATYNGVLDLTYLGNTGADAQP